MINVSGKTFVVTGGSRGIGKAIVIKLAENGANVAFTYQSNASSASQLVADLQQDGYGRVMAFQSDVAHPLSADKVIQEVEMSLGAIDGLVNNAGITKDNAFYRMTSEQWTNVIDTNLNGVFYLSKAYIAKAVRQGGGKIVNMASVSGIRGMKGQANYSASKGGLIALTQTLAVEYARLNMQINAIAPGYIETEMVEAMPEDKKKIIQQMIPQKCLGKPEDVANLTLFLLSDMCNYLTGQTIVIDGGLSV
jgi:3-oxoacyl-[acyl-carrier protein] reductase